MNADVVLGFYYEVERTNLWEALTNSEIHSKWVMDNNSKVEESYELQFISEPNKWWDGSIKGEVLTVNEPDQFILTWKRVGEETVVALTLTPDESNESNLDFGI